MAPIVVDERGIFCKVFYDATAETCVYYILPGQDVRARTH
jgi:hypothetical protein